MKKTLSIIMLFAAALCIFAAAASAADQAYPSGNITISVAYSAGGASDKLARIVQPYLQNALGTNVVVENQPGAGGQIAAEAFLRKPADGYSLLAINVPGLYYTVALQETTYGYDDLVPVWIESYDPIIMLVLNSSKFNTLADFIEGAKAEPGKYSVGYVPGGGQQATAEFLKAKLGLDVNMVTFDGGSGASAALLGGHVDVIVGDAYGRADIASEAKPLAISSTSPNSAWPKAVSFNEQLKPYNVAFPSDEFQARRGCYFVSKKFVEQYPDRYEKLIDAFKTVAKNDEYISMLKKANLYDSCVLTSGKEYSDQLTQMADEVKNVVVPLLSEIKQ